MEQSAETKTKATPEIVDEDIKYISIEAINKDDKDASAVISGLFKGLKVRKNETTEADETFFMVHDEKDSTFVLNNEFHNVISIEVLGETVRTMTYFMMTDEDQIAAGLLLSNLMESMVEKNMVLSNDTTMVDILKFKDVPEDILKGNTSAVKAGAHSTGKSTYSGAKGVGTTHKPTTTTTYVRKESTPHLWKRRSKKPTEEALMTLSLKVTAMGEGKLKVKIPKLPGDDKKDDKTTTKNASTGQGWEDVDDGNFPYGGMM